MWYFQQNFSCKKVLVSIRIKYYLSHSTRCRDRQHTRQLRVERGKPPARTRTAPTVNPEGGPLIPAKALASTQKSPQREHSSPYNLPSCKNHSSLEANSQHFWRNWSRHGGKDPEIRTKEDPRELSQKNNMCFIKDDWLLLVSGEMTAFPMKEGRDDLKSPQGKQKKCR